LTDDPGSVDKRIEDLATAADYFQYGTLGWIRSRGLDLDDYCAHLASFTWSSSRPGAGARRIADVIARQVAASGALVATVTGDDSEASIDLVGPDAETLEWTGATAADTYREIELIFGAVATRLGHELALEAGDGAARIRIRPSETTGSADRT
jgi:hypothetical protein